MDKTQATKWLQGQKNKVRDGDVAGATDRAKAAAVEVEEWLRSHGVRFAPATNIPMAMIDERASRNNQARREPIVAESVDRFATSLRNDAVFPPIVVFPRNHKLVVVDGNNRHAATKKVGRDSIWGIVISEDVTSDMIHLLTVEANAKHGVTPPLEWRIQQAFHLSSLGFRDEEVAGATGISVQQLRGARSVREADQRASALRIAGFDQLAATTRQVLNAIRDEAVFFQAARIAIGTKMTGEEVRDLCRHLKTLPSEAARITHLGEVARERELEAATRNIEGKRMRAVTSPQLGLVTGLGQLLKVDAAALARQVVTEKDRDLLMKRLELATDHILNIQVALEQIHMQEGD